MSKKEKKLIVVLGMHRSGTSAIAGLLSHLGAEFGNNLIPPGPDNAKGFFEDSGLVALNDDILAEFGLTWTSCRKIEWNDSILNELTLKYRERSDALIEQLASSGANVTGMKDPRISRLLPYWNQVFSNADVSVDYLWVLRDPIAVYQSLTRRNGYNEDKSLALWARYNLDILEFAQHKKLELIDFDDAVNDNAHTTTHFVDCYNLDSTNAKCENFLDGSLRHNQNTFRDSPGEGSARQSIIRTHLFGLYSSLKTKSTQAIATDDIENYLETSADHLDQISDLVDDIRYKEQFWLHEKNLQISEILKTAENREEELQVEIRRLSQQVEALDEETNRLYTENYRLNAQVADIFSSRSWKVTRIYRFLGRKIYSLFRTPIYIKVYSRHLISMISQSISSLASSSRSNQPTTHELAQGRTQALTEALDKAKKKTGELPVIDISFVTHNSSEWLGPFFSSLCKQRYPLSKINLLITENSSEDDTPDKLIEITAPLHQKFRSIDIAKQPNNGFGSGHDHAISRGSSRFVLVTNVDLEFTESSIIEAVSSATKDSEDIASWEMRQQPYEHPKYYDPITLTTSWSSHACILLLREAYLRAGGYEKRIFMYGEDVELSYRFRRAGYKLKYVPTAVVSHYSYENETDFKLTQFYGSTLANAYIRLRYGNLRDVLGLVGLYVNLYINGGPPSISRTGILKNFAKVLLNTPYFLASRRKPVKNTHFPFRKWDYEMLRDGAFYVSPNSGSSRPKVSIITRTYQGRENWLTEAISSVVNQTYDRIELIIVEDGGNSQEALAKESSGLFTGERTIHYSAQPKMGRSYNGNAGLEAASGDYIMFLDDDDLLFPDHVEILAKELIADEEFSASYALSWEVATDYLSDEDRLYEEKMHATPHLLRQEFDREVLKTHNYFPIQSVLFRRILFEKYGGFDVDMCQLEDWDLWFRYSSESVFKYVPKVTSLYRTPYKNSDRANRHQQLHENYEYAKLKQATFLRSLSVVNPIMKNLGT